MQKKVETNDERESEKETGNQRQEKQPATGNSKDIWLVILHTALMCSTATVG